MHPGSGRLIDLSVFVWMEEVIIVTYMHKAQKLDEVRRVKSQRRVSDTARREWSTVDSERSWWCVSANSITSQVIRYR